MPFDSSWLSSGGVQGVQENMDRDLTLKKKRWETQQTQDAAAAFAQSLNPDGSLDEGRYYRLVSERGIAPALATGYRDWTLGQAQAQTGLAQQRVGQRMVGFSPDAAKPSQDLQNQDQFLNPTGASSSSPLSSSSPQEFAERVAGRANPTRTGARAPSKTITESSAAPTTTPGGSGYGVSGASVSGEGGAAAGGTMTANDPRALEGMGNEPQPKYGQIQGFVATDTGFNPMAILKGAGFKPKTVQDYSDPQAREEAARGLEARFSIHVKRDKNGNADPQSVADGANTIAAQNYQAQFKGFDPFNMGETMKTAIEGSNTGPAAAQKAVEEIGEAGRSVKSTRQAQARTGQEIKKTNWEIASVEDARRGNKEDGAFGNVTPGNVETFRDVASTYGWLKASKGHVAEMIHDLQAGKELNPEQFGGLLIGLTQSMKNGDKITTEKQEADFMSTLRRKKTTGQIVQEARGLKDLSELALKNQIAPQDQAEILANLNVMLNQQLKSGSTRTKLDQYRTPKERAEAALRDRGEAAAGKGPKIGETRTIGGVTGVWDGKTWRRK